MREGGIKALPLGGSVGASRSQNQRWFHSKLVTHSGPRTKQYESVKLLLTAQNQT